jgi:hypothetical protein
MKQKETEEFWEWFYQNHENFGEHLENSDLLAELDERIQELGPYSWEVGPGKTEKYALTISPNGDPDLLIETKEIVANSINCADWEYHYAKPKKDWHLIFEFKSQNGNTVQVDANSWTYTLFQYEDGMFDILIKADNISSFDDDDKMYAAEILLDGLMGFLGKNRK